MQGGAEGFFSLFYFRGRTILELVRIDRDTEYLLISLYPNISCAKEHRASFGEFLARISDSFKAGGIRMEGSGALIVHLGSPIKKQEVTAAMFKHMERVGLSLLFDRAEVLERVTHGFPSKRGEDDREDRDKADDSGLRDVRMHLQ